MTRAMKKLIIMLSLSSFLMIAGSSFVWAGDVRQGYFSVLPDVPLMAGMDEVEDQTFVFDKAEGRVIETAGFLAQSQQTDPQTYYSDVLGQLGWKPLKSGLFTRGGEQLVVIVRKVKGGELVKFSLAPHRTSLSR